LSPRKGLSSFLTLFTSAAKLPGILKDGGPVECTIKHLVSYPL